MFILRKINIVLIFISMFYLLFYSCGTKKKFFSEFNQNLNKVINQDELTLSTLFGKVIEAKLNYIVIKVDDKKREILTENVGNLEDYLIKVYKQNCLNRNGKLELIDNELDKKFSDMIYNQIQSNDFPDVYLKEYLKKDYKVNSFMVKKFYNIPEDTFIFCYLPESKRFYSVAFDKKNNLIKLYRGSVLGVIPKYAEEESKKLKEKIQKIIEKDLENLVWFSLNLPLYYKGIKLYYFEARPVYETEEDRKANLGTDRWDVYIKLKNTTLKPFILNIGKITFIINGEEYKPLFKIDEKGNIKGIEISGDCKRIEGNRVIIPPYGKCNIYYIYDRLKKEGGLKFIGVKNLKGGILIFDVYPIYIWSMTTYDMKIEGLSIEDNE